MCGPTPVRCMHLTPGACAGRTTMRIRTRGEPVGSDPLDQRRGAEPPAAAHRHEADLLVGALELVQQRGDQTRAGRAEGVAERHRAAVDVDAVHVGLELTAPGGDYEREGLVYIAQVDVADRQRA